MAAIFCGAGLFGSGTRVPAILAVCCLAVLSVLAPAASARGAEDACTISAASLQLTDSANRPLVDYSSRPGIEEIVRVSFRMSFGNSSACTEPGQTYAFELSTSAGGGVSACQITATEPQTFDAGGYRELECVLSWLTPSNAPNLNVTVRVLRDGVQLQAASAPLQARKS
jgi:hypothetical protein